MLLASSLSPCWSHLTSGHHLALERQPSQLPTTTLHLCPLLCQSLLKTVLPVYTITFRSQTWSASPCITNNYWWIVIKPQHILQDSLASPILWVAWAFPVFTITNRNAKGISPHPTPAIRQCPWDTFFKWYYQWKSLITFKVLMHSLFCQRLDLCMASPTGLPGAPPLGFHYV